MTTQDAASAIANDFFDSYLGALLDRDVHRIADAYHCPALIVFPANTIAVTSPQQTIGFFQQAIGQYADVTAASSETEVIAATDHSIWAAVAWHYGGSAEDERMLYQLVATEDGWRIAVLTPLDP